VTTDPYVSLYVFMSVPIILLRFMLKMNFLNIYLKKLNISNFMKIFKWKLSCSIRTGGQTIVVALRDIAKAPNEWQLYRSLGKNLTV